MFKSELVNRLVAKDILPSNQARPIVDAVFNEIKLALLRGEDVSIPGFGVFKVRDVAARKGVNPRTGEEIQIPEMRRVHFTQGKYFKGALNK